MIWARRGLTAILYLYENMQVITVQHFLPYSTRLLFYPLVQGWMIKKPFEEKLMEDTHSQPRLFPLHQKWIRMYLWNGFPGTLCVDELLIRVILNIEHFSSVVVFLRHKKIHIFLSVASLYSFKKTRVSSRWIKKIDLCSVDICTAFYIHWSLYHNQIKQHKKNLCSYEVEGRVILSS